MAASSPALLDEAAAAGAKAADGASAADGVPATLLKRVLPHHDESAGDGELSESRRPSLSSSAAVGEAPLRRPSSEMRARDALSARWERCEANDLWVGLGEACEVSTPAPQCDDLGGLDERCCCGSKIGRVLPHITMRQG